MTQSIKEKIDEMNEAVRQQQKHMEKILTEQWYEPLLKKLQRQQN